MQIFCDRLKTTQSIFHHVYSCTISYFTSFKESVTISAGTSGIYLMELIIIGFFFSSCLLSLWLQKSLKKKKDLFCKQTKNYMSVHRFFCCCSSELPLYFPMVCIFHFLLQHVVKIYFVLWCYLTHSPQWCVSSISHMQLQVIFAQDRVNALKGSGLVARASVCFLWKFLTHTC